MKKKDDMIVLVVTLRCLLNDEAATLYMMRSDEEENQNEGLRFSELCVLLILTPPTSPMKLKLKQGNAQQRIRLIWNWSIIFILIKINIIIKTKKYWTGVIQAFRIWPSKVEHHNPFKWTILAVGNCYSHVLNCYFHSTCSIFLF